MDFPLKFCPDGWVRLERLRELYEKHPQDKIYARMEVHTEALQCFADRYGHGPTSCPELEERVAFWNALLAERMAIRDDSVPAAYLSELDQGVYGGIVGGKVRFMAHPENGWISSMVPPICHDWGDFEKLAIDPQGQWFQFHRRVLAVFRRGPKGNLASAISFSSTVSISFSSSLEAHGPTSN